MSKTTFALLQKTLALVNEGFALDESGKLVELNKDTVKESDDIFHRMMLEKAYELYEAESVAENDAELEAMSDEIKFEELAGHAKNMQTDNELPAAPQANAAPAAAPAAGGIPALPESVEEFDFDSLFKLSEDDDELSIGDGEGESVPADDGMGGMAEPAGMDDFGGDMGGDAAPADDDMASLDGAGMGGDDFGGDMGGEPAPAGDDGFSFDMSLADELHQAADALNNVADKIGGGAGGDDLGGSPDDFGGDDFGGDAAPAGDDFGGDMGGDEPAPVGGEEPALPESKGGKSRMAIVPGNRRASAARPMGK